VPVSVAMLKTANDLPLLLEPEEPLFPEPLFPPPPQAAAIRATPTAKDAAVSDHFHRLLRINSLPPRLA